MIARNLGERPWAGDVFIHLSVPPSMVGAPGRTVPEARTLGLGR
jgi:hypothetical protein